MTHTGKPTTYKGINFRSRLEARWAAMFDLLEWPWEYEPEAPGAYIPDFALHGSKGNRVFVEVKPLVIYLEQRRAIIDKARRSIGDADLLIVVDGLVPGNEADLSLGFIPDELGCVDWETGINPMNADDNAILFQPGRRHHGLEYDYAGDYGYWGGRLTKAYDGNSLFQSTIVGKLDLLALWSRAGNAIQWKPAT